MIAIHACNEGEAALAQMNNALQELAEINKVVSREVFKRVFNRGYNRAGDSYEKQVAKLCPSILQEGWLACLKEFGTPSNHQSLDCLVEPLDQPTIYSPLILLGFNEEEYMNHPTDEEGVTAVGEVGTTQGI